MTKSTSSDDNGYLEIFNDDAFWLMLRNLGPYDGTLKDGSADDLNRLESRARYSSPKTGRGDD